MLQAAGVELGMNYPLPIVEIDAAKDRLQENLIVMWQLEAASRAAIENGAEEGLGDSTESPPIAFPQDTMEVDHEPHRNSTTNFSRRHQDQMVPSMTSSFIRVESESSSEHRSSSDDRRQEVPLNIIVSQEAVRETPDQGGPQMVRNNTTPAWFNINQRMQNVEDIAESSSIGRTGRDGGVVPVWCPSSSSSSERFQSEENDLEISSSFLQRHPQQNEIDWRRLSQAR